MKNTVEFKEGKEQMKTPAKMAEEKPIKSEMMNFLEKSEEDQAKLYGITKAWRSSVVQQFENDRNVRVP